MTHDCDSEKPRKRYDHDLNDRHNTLRCKNHLCFYSLLQDKNTNLMKVKEEEPPSNRISFLSNDNIPYTSIVMKMRANKGQEQSISDLTFHYPSYSGNSEQIETELRNYPGSSISSERETLLLDLVRARNRSIEDEALDKPLALPNDDNSDDDISSEACIHGLSMRMTERSISRSRVSRISTRRDMDIPSILAFSMPSMTPTHNTIPAFQNINTPKLDNVPRWSIRRSVCPVCSQKWKDRSSVKNVKYSGLKRNSSIDLPSIIAPARLRTSITIGYVPRPAQAAIDEDAGLGHGAGGLRNTSASWQLTRARRFRTPKLPMPPLEDTQPLSSTAPLARKDLDQRVIRFLTDAPVKLP